MKKWGKKKAIVTIVILFATLVVLANLKPRLEKRLLKQIIAEAENIPQLKDVKIRRLQLRLIPPHLKLHDLSVKLADVEAISDEGLVIKQVSIYPNLINLLSAQIKIKHIVINGTKIKLQKMVSKSDEPLPEFNYEDLRALPFTSFQILNSLMEYENFQFKIADVLLRKRWNSVELTAANVQGRDKKQALPDIKLQSTRMHIYPEQITLGNFTLNTEKSYLQMGLKLNSAFSTQLLQVDPWIKSEANIAGKIQLDEFEDFAQQFISKNTRRPFQGVLQLGVYSQLDSNQIPKYTLNTLWKNLQFDSYKVKQVELLATLRKSDLSINKLQVEDELLKISNAQTRFKIDFKKPKISTNASININQINIGKFLSQNLGLSGVPLHAPLNAQIKCQGELYPNISSDCDIKGNFNNIKVWSSDSRLNEEIIADLSSNSFEAKGHLGKNSLNFETYHNFSESSVSAKGNVDYIKGFDIYYHSELFSFTDINNLANIPMSGFGKVSGHTKGSANWGTFTADVDLNDFHFFNYNLGNTTGTVSYKDQQLQFDNMLSKINASVVQANVGLNLQTQRISVTAESEKLSIQDTLSAIKEVAEVPVYLSGLGQFNLELEGPLELGQMSYDLNAEFKNGMIHKDRYSNLKIDLASEKGHVDVNTSLFYLSDQFNISGTVDPKGQIDITAMADSINLSNIMFFKDLGINLEGLATLQIDLTDHILLPIVTGHALTKTLNTASQTGASDFKFHIHKDYSEFEGSFFDSKAIGHFMIPHNEQGYLGAKADVSDFNPLTLLAVFNSKVSETYAQVGLTGSIDIKSQGDLAKNLNGMVNFEKIVLGGDSVHSVESVGTTRLSFTKGGIDGGVRLTDNYNNILNIFFNRQNGHRAQGKLNLGVLRAFVPDLNDSRGVLSIDAGFNVLPKFSMNGTGNIENLYLKLNDLKHPFQNINSRLSLQDTKVIFQGIQGEFANGLIEGAGYVDLNDGFKVNIAGKADRLNLEVPEDVKTLASGNFYFNGDGFPYTLGGSFTVESGFFEMELTSNDGANFTIAPSLYLPNSRKESPPLLLDLEISTNQALKVKNSMIDGLANAELRIQGSPTRPLFTGTIDILPNTLLLFQDKQFETTSGRVTFDQSEPSNAQLNLSAEIRLTDYNEIMGKDYDIQVIVQGSANDPNIFFSSQPSLTEDQILSLIALGVKDSNRLGQEISSDSQQSQTGYQLGGIFLQNEFARDLQDRLGVQVNFTSSFEDQDVSPKFLIQKKFNPKLSITGSRTLGTNKRTSTQIEYKFTKNFSIIGGWENFELEDATLLRTRRFQEPNVVGVDVQYSFEFE